MLRSVISRPDFAVDWEPSAELLARGVEDPLLGDPLHLLFARERSAGTAVLLVRARDLRPLHPTLDFAGIGYGPDDFVSFGWVADAAEAAGVARGYLLAGDVTGVTETTVIVGPQKLDTDGWRADKVGGFIGQARAFEIEVDLSRPRPTTGDPSEFDRNFMDLSCIAVGRDDWAGRDLVGEDLARWRREQT